MAATVLDSSYPYDGGQQVNEAEWRLLWDHLFVWGVKPTGDMLEVFADSTGTQVKVKPGECLLNAHYGALDSTATLTIGGDPPGAGQSRIARVVLRNNFTDKRIELDVLPGTNSSSPAAPALTRSSTVWEQSLAQVRITADNVVSIPAEAVTDERTFLRPAGGVKPGDLIFRPSNAAPFGCLPCDGRAVSRITYAELFAVIGTVYGAGDGSSTFNLPDYRGEVLACQDNFGGSAAGRLPGSMSSLAAHYGSSAPLLTRQNLPPLYMEKVGINAGAGSTEVVTQVADQSVGGANVQWAGQSQQGYSTIQPSHLVAVWIAARPA